MIVGQSIPDQNRAAYLATNPIAIGPAGDPEDFRREFQRFERLLPPSRIG